MSKKQTESFFYDEIDFENFKLLLDSLNHVKPVYISREEYKNLSWDILKVTGKDKVWEFYDLYLPTDLKKAELLSLSILLTQKFKIKEYAHLENLISKVKLLVELITRELPDDKKEEFIKEMLVAGNVDDSLYYRIVSQKMLFWPARELLRSFDGEKLSSEELILELQDILEKEFHLTFFRKWVNMLRLGMMTMTAGEIPDIKKKEGDIQVNIHPRELDKIERLVREKIWIDYFKKEILDAQKSWNQVIVDRIKLKATNKILKTLHEFPFQLTKDDYGFQPSKILEHKEIYCVGGSILGHAFLSELCIEHYWLSIPDHSALEVVLWWKRYYFDVTSGTHLFIIKQIKEVWVYEYVDVEQAGKKYIHKWEVEKVLFWHVFNNLSVTLIEQNKFKEAFILLKKSILINPEDSFAYKLIGDCLFKLQQYHKAIEYINIALEMKPNDPDMLNAYAINISWLEKYEESLELYDKILKIDPELVDVYRNKALSYFFLERYNEALDITLKWLKKFPKDNLLHFWKAGILVKLKRYSEALMILDRLYDIFINDNDFYFNRGEIFEKTWNVLVWKLYYLISDFLSGKEVIIETPEEKSIKDFMLTKDFEGLKKFMLSLEKNSN